MDGMLVMRDYTERIVFEWPPTPTPTQGGGLLVQRCNRQG